MDKIIELCNKVQDSIKESNKCLQELKKVCNNISKKYKKNDTYSKCIILADMALIEINLAQIKNMEIDMNHDKDRD